MTTLAQHLAAHSVDDPNEDTHLILCCCGAWFDNEAAHRAHVAATWQQARTITTRAQLDALPVGTVVRDHDADIMVSGPTGEGDAAWWYDGDPYRANEVDLPALVVWTPADGGDQ